MLRWLLLLWGVVLLRRRHLLRVGILRRVPLLLLLLLHMRRECVRRRVAMSVVDRTLVASCR